MPDSNQQHETPANTERAAKTGLPKIVWIIPAAALILLGLIGYRLTYGPMWRQSGQVSFQARPAPLISLMNQMQRHVRTKQFQGRQPFLALFFDASSGAEGHRQMVILREGDADFQAAQTEVLAITGTPPDFEREEASRFPFHILLGLDYAVHRQWGVTLPTEGEFHPVLFLVDRSGMIRWSQEIKPTDPPIPLPTILKHLEEIH